MSDAPYRVFGLDRQLYGPVTRERLADWARDGRVQRDTWIHREPGDLWQRAEALGELQEFFGAVVSPHASEAGGARLAPVHSRSGVSPKFLTRLRAFSDLGPEELAPFAAELVEESYRPFSYIVRQGSHGDAMYFVIQGKVGVSTKGQVTESFLVTLTIGDTFGEMSLFDPGPRSADVRAETDVVVFKLTSEALQKVCREAPAAAGRFLWNIARLLSARVRAMDKRAATAKDLDAAGRSVQ